MAAPTKPLAEQVAYDVRNLINASIDSKIMGIAKSTQIFDAMDAITLAKRIIKYDEIRNKSLSAIEAITAE